MLYYKMSYSHSHSHSHLELNFTDILFAGHARSLSRSTTDWADMMRRSVNSAALTEKKRLVRQGAVVTKHSENKRGCGPRFLAVNVDDQV